MPLVDENPNQLLGQTYSPVDPDTRITGNTDVPEPSIGDVVSAAFGLENTLISMFSDERGFAYDLRNKYINPDFDPADIPSGYEEYTEDFMYAQNETERNSLVNQIDKERDQRKTLDNSGFLGVVSMISAGVLDPINLIPVGGQAAKVYKTGGNILKNGGRVALTAGAAASASEALLQESQVTRTFGESAAAIGGATFLGGLLGGAAGSFSRAEIDNIGKVIDSEMDINIDLPIEKTADDIAKSANSTVGAAQAPVTTLEQETIKGTFGLDSAIKAVSDKIGLTPPNISLLKSPSKAAREASQQLMENPLYMNKNAEGIASAVAAESNINLWQGEWGEILTQAHKNYVNFRKTPNSKGISRTGFNELVGEAMRRGDVSNIPEVASTAKSTRKLLDKLKNDAIANKLLPEDVDVDTALSYFTRQYKRDKILANRNIAPEAGGKSWDDSLRNWAETAIQKEKLRFLEGNPEKLDPTTLANEARIRFDDVSDQYIQDVIDNITDRITGTPSDKLPFRIVASERGPLKARTFNISDYAIEPFLESDFEEVLNRTVRMMSSDIEITKAFGDPTMENVLGSKTKGIKGTLADDYQRLKDEAGKITNEKDRVKKIKKLAKQEREDRKNLEGVRDILRGDFGTLGTDPDNVWRKAAFVSRSLQYMSKLGGVALSSSADVARPAVAHGFVRAYGDILPSLITNLKKVKLAAKDAEAAGIGSEAALNTRTAAISDVLDPYSSKTAFASFVNNTTKYFNKATGINFWNDTMKTWTGIVSQNRIIDVVNKKAAGKSVSKSDNQLIRFLGFDDQAINDVAGQVRKHGGKEGKIWTSNVRNWENENAARIYKAALNKDVNRIIVTPAAGDIPLNLRTELGKTIGQFQSFNIAATQRVLLNSLQQRDAAALNGITFMVSGGMMAYYLKTVSRGGKLSDDPRVWAFEGIDRSGLLAVIMEANNRFEKLGGYGMSQALGAERASRFQSRNAVGAWLGPSFGTLSDTLSVASGLARGDADKSTVRAVRRMLPFQNLFYTRRLFDKIEQNIVSEVTR